MSNYPPPGMPPTAYPQPAYPPPPQPSGCGCGGCLGKLFILLGVVFFLLIVVCCGGGYFLFRNSGTSNANDVNAIRDEIIPMQVPPSLQPGFGFRFKWPGSGELLMDEAVYVSSDRKSMLTVTCFGDALAPQYKDNLKRILESGQQQPATGNNERDEKLKDEKETTVERTIGGETARFHITQGIGVKSGTKKIRVNGAFQGKAGPAVLIISADEATLSREKVDEIINSIGGDEKAKNK